jgi:hypothetical protein
MQANSISNAYRACFCENKVQEKGVPHYFDITTLTTRPSLFFFENYPVFKWHSTPTSCKILKAPCYREQSPAPVLTAPSQKEFVRNKYSYI